MDRHDAVRNLEQRLGCSGRVKDFYHKLEPAHRHTLLIGSSWVALAAFILFPEVQLIAFGAAVIGVAILNKGGTDI